MRKTERKQIENVTTVFVFAFLSFWVLTARYDKCFRNAMRSSFWGKKLPHDGYILATIMDRSFHLLCPALASPVLKLLGQPSDVADLSGIVCMWSIPIHFSFAFQFPLQRFLQSQLKTGVIAFVTLVALLVHVLSCWLFVHRLQLGVVGTTIILNFSWWVLVFGAFGLLIYTVFGGCRLTWTGFSIDAFSGLWEFVKLSAASGVMLWSLSLSLSELW